MANVPGSIVSHPLTAAFEAGGDRRVEAVETVREALMNRDGVVTHAASDLGVSRWTMIRWFTLVPSLKTYAAKLREDSNEHAQRLDAVRPSRWQAK